MISLRSDIARKVLNYFFLQQGVETYVNALARILCLESGNLTRKLLELEKDGILRSRWQGKQRYYSLNAGFPLLHEYRSIVLKTVGFEQALRVCLMKIPGIKTAVIFGSYAQDQMDAHSDIDLLVVGTHDTIELNKAVAEIQKKMQREINVISMSSKEYNDRKKGDPLIGTIQGKKRIVII